LDNVLAHFQVKHILAVDKAIQGAELFSRGMTTNTSDAGRRDAKRMGLIYQDHAVAADAARKHATDLEARSVTAQHAALTASLAARTASLACFTAADSTAYPNDDVIESALGTFAVPGAPEGYLAAALADIEKIKSLDLGQSLGLGKPGDLGREIDPRDDGPLGALWPTGDPDWYPGLSNQLTETIRQANEFAEKLATSVEPLEFLLDPGSASAEEIGELFAEISKLYRMMGGTPIRFVMADCREPKFAKVPL
jgi:hypothetical protein